MTGKALDELQISRIEDIAIVKLNRPQARNALSLSLQEMIVSAFDDLTRDESVSAIILTGEGDRAFCAGLDLQELSRGIDLVNAGVNPVAAVAQCPVPTIGAINGAAITGGFELALACDILLASQDAFFADTHAKMGVMPGWGLSQRLSRRIGIGRAKEISLSNRPISASRALEWGLVNHVYPKGQLLAEAIALAREIAQWDRAFIRQYKALISDGFSLTEADSLEKEVQVSGGYNQRLTPTAIGSR